MKRWPSLLLLLLLTFVLPTTAAHAPGPLLYFTDNLNPNHPDPTLMEQALLDQINAATHTIDAALYGFNRPSIRDALIAAHQRGVIVRIVTDDDERYQTPSSAPTYTALENAGIPIVDDQRSGSLMHNKYLLIDGRFLWTGATNLTDNGFTSNHNNSLLFESAELVSTYQNDFNQMFVAHHFSNGKDPSPRTHFTYNGIPVQIYFSPEDQSLNALIERVNAATSTINFAIYYLTNDRLRDALIAAHQRGIHIRGVWDTLGAGHAASDDEALCAVGISIKRETFPGLMHNKFMVIDPDTPNPILITGSMNWSAAGDQENDENTLIIEDPTTATAYQQAFDTFYTTLPATTNCQYIPGSQTAVYLPLTVLGHIDPIPPSPAAPHVVLTTIVYNPPGSDVDGEYVEISNLGTAPQDMTGWHLSDQANTTYTFPAFNLADGHSVRIWVKPGTNTATDLYWGRGSSVWNNTGDSALLTNAHNETIDTCTYAGGGETAVCHPSHTTSN